MGMESTIDSRKLSPLARQKMQELVAVLAAEEYGDDGRPPIDTDFATIENFGHQAGCHVAQALDEHLTRRHAEHFQEPQTHPCPTCGECCELADAAKERPLQTGDGPVTLVEPALHCPVCHRDFFPSAQRVEN